MSSIVRFHYTQLSLQLIPNDDYTFRLLLYCLLPLFVNTSCCEGSQLEVEIAREDDVASFVTEWLAACSRATGAGQTMMADLEVFESQDSVSVICCC